ncbi:MAG: hypothetical protein JNK85_21700 [Verrucomicrobiales bacterium]|nr:hypothetical protein [Verrucomicrobiales bacterium]
MVSKICAENPGGAAEATSLAESYEWIAQTIQPARLPADWASLAKSSNTNLAGLAGRKLTFLELIRKPIEMKFTALDRRSVDLNKLLGKVVLLDF